MGAVLSTSFYLPFGLRASDRHAVVAALIQDLICYDAVCVLTDQMAAVGPLLAELGPDVLDQLISDGVLSFIHDRQILSWPIWKGYTGPAPVFALESMSATPGFTQAETREVAFQLAIAMDVSPKRARDLGRRIELATTDFVGLPDAPAGSRPSFQANVVEQLTTYRDAIGPGGHDGLTRSDITRVIREFRKPNRDPLKTKDHRVARLETKPGWAALEAGKPLQKKQFALLSMFLADRTIAVLARSGLEATVHADPSVESVFSARLDHVRPAAGAELNELLRVAEVRLPVLLSPGPIDFAGLVAARSSIPGQAFRRRVVEQRDSEAGLDLLQAYHRTLTQRIGDRFGVKTARFVASAILGFVPGFNLGASVLDSFLVDHLLSRREPSFLIDDTLRRLTSQE
jgi:hypothetical protein